MCACSSSGAKVFDAGEKCENDLEPSGGKIMNVRDDSWIRGVGGITL